MKSHIPLTAAQRQAIRKECDRQAVEFETEHGQRICAVMLWSLHRHTGWGKKRLLAFWNTLKEEHQRLIKCYEMPDDWQFLCEEHLKRIGIDVDELWEDLKKEDSSGS